MLASYEVNPTELRGIYIRVNTPGIALHSSKDQDTYLMVMSLSSIGLHWLNAPKVQLTKMTCDYLSTTQFLAVSMVALQLFKITIFNAFGAPCMG